MAAGPASTRAGSASASPRGEAIRHAIVTGGSLGIGRAVAARLHAEGYALTLFARGADALEEAREALTAAGRPPVGTAVCDVTDRGALTAAIAAAERARGPCHTLVTAAGHVRPGRFENLTEADFRAQMEVNFHGAVGAVEAVWPGMVARGAGRIAMVSSAAALVGIYGYTAYASSKFALRGFAEALRGEARVHGIAVAIVYPGDTDTAQYRLEVETRPPETAAIAGKASLQSPEAVARAIVRGLDRGTFAIYPNLPTAALGRTASAIAPVLNAVFDRIVRRHRG